MATGMKILIHCAEDGLERDVYRSCRKAELVVDVPHHHHHATHVVVFQILMALFGGLAYWGVQIRRQYGMSQFDHRRQRYVPVQQAL